MSMHIYFGLLKLVRTVHTTYPRVDEKNYLAKNSL